MKAPVHVTDFINPASLTAPKIPATTAANQIEWSEVQRYHQERDRELTQKEKELVERRKREVKAVLDAQVREQKIATNKQNEERKNYEIDLLNKCS